jgi:hypothetical protein
MYLDDNGTLEKITLDIDQSTENLARKLESKMPPSMELFFHSVDLLII